MRSLQEHQQAQIRAMLDPPQIAEYEKMLREREEQMQTRIVRQGAGAGPDAPTLSRDLAPGPRSPAVDSRARLIPSRFGIPTQYSLVIL